MSAAITLDDIEELTPLADLPPWDQQWLWEGYLPEGAVVVVDGDPGVGKSSMMCDLTARLSTGDPLPEDRGKRKPIASILFNAEDPRGLVAHKLQLAGADLDMVTAYGNSWDAAGEHPVTLPGDIEWLEQDITQRGARFVVIDPLMAFLSGQVDSHKDQDVRRVMSRLADVAERTGTTIVLVRHLTKGSNGGPAMYRGGGSIGIVGAARVGLMVAKHPEDDDMTVLAVTKNNLARKAQSLAYRVGEGHGIEWLGSVTLNAEDLSSKPSGGSSDASLKQQAVDYLTEVLRGNPTWNRDLRDEFEEAFGGSYETLNNARKSLGVLAKQLGRDYGSVWYFPEDKGSVQPVVDESTLRARQDPAPTGRQESDYSGQVPLSAYLGSDN